MHAEERRKEIATGNLRQTQTMKFFDNIMVVFKLSTNRALANFLCLPESKISKYINGVMLPGYERCLHIQDVLYKHGMKIDINDIRPKK